MDFSTLYLAKSISATERGKEASLPSVSGIYFFTTTNPPLIRSQPVSKPSSRAHGAIFAPFSILVGTGSFFTAAKQPEASISSSKRCSGFAGRLLPSAIFRASPCFAGLAPPAYIVLYNPSGWVGGGNLPLQPPPFVIFLTGPFKKGPQNKSPPSAEAICFANDGPEGA